MEELTGKVAFITGGASGIGLGSAKAFLAAGMNVAIADVRRDHLERAMTELAGSGDAVMPVVLNVADRIAMAAAAAAVMTRFGRVDVLFNNAGVGILGSIRDASHDDWDWMLSVNLDAVFSGVKEFLPYIREGKAGGHVVSTASIGGLMVTANGGVYSTSKFGVVAMMDCLRDDLAGEGIGVSVLCPAAVNTNIHQHDDLRPGSFADTGYQENEVQKAERLAKLKDMLARGVDPRAVGDLVLDGIRRNSLYIFTNSFAPLLEARRDALLASLPNEPVNEERLALELRLRQMMPAS